MLQRPLNVFLLIAALSTVAEAQTYRYTARGTLTSAAPGLDPELWDPVQVGDPFAVTYVIDTNTSPGLDDPTRAIYTEPIVSVEVDLGGITATLDSLSGTSAQVTNDRTVGGGCRDDLVFLVAANSFEVDTIDVLLVANETLPACPSTSLEGTQYPTNVVAAGFNLSRRFELVTTSFGLFEGFVDSVSVELPYVSLCSGDGGNQAGCSDCPCGNNAPAGTTGGCRNSSGSSTRLLASGDTSVSLPVADTGDLRFGLEDAPPGAFCVLLSGAAVAPQNMTSPCFGLETGIQAMDRDGLRCAIQDTRRHGGRSADLNGEVGTTNGAWGGASNPPAGLAGQGAGFVAGQTRFFQVTHRDDPTLVCQRGLNTSQAVRVTFSN